MALSGMFRMFGVPAPAEGRADPWWSDPREAPARIARVKALMDVHLPQETKERVIFFICNSVNDNAVLYLSSRTEERDASGAVSTVFSVVPCWFRAQPEHRDEELAKEPPNHSLLRPLEGMHEKLYAIDMDEQFNVRMKLGLVPHVIKVRAGPHGRHAAVTDVGGAPAKLEHGYAQMKRGLEPSVDWVTVRGLSLSTRQVVEETLEPPAMSMMNILAMLGSN
jgi:hypothetical protein